MADETNMVPQLGRLRDLLGAYRISQIIVVAAKLGIADQLAGGPRSVEELAAATGAKAPALYRVLRALASFEIFREREDGKFEITPLAEGLRTDVPGSVHGTAVCYGEAWWWDSWGRLYDTVMTGETAFDLLHKEPLFDYLQKHPSAEAAFNAHMDSVTALIARAVADSYDFSWAGSVCDVGGGQGVMLRTVLEKHARLRGILFDQSSVIASAREKFPADMLARCDLVAGSFFEQVPSGADAYLMKNIIHDWEDERALIILRNCRAAMSTRSRLVLVEAVIPPGNAPSLGKLWDMTMLTLLRGVERTEEEYRSLLRSAQFELTRVIDLPGDVHAVEAVPS
jgi:hypothetical protein